MVQRGEKRAGKSSVLDIQEMWIVEGGERGKMGGCFWTSCGSRCHSGSRLYNKYVDGAVRNQTKRVKDFHFWNLVLADTNEAR